jgi:hypothetical protein
VESGMGAAMVFAGFLSGEVSSISLGLSKWTATSSSTAKVIDGSNFCTARQVSGVKQDRSATEENSSSNVHLLNNTAIVAQVLSYSTCVRC